MKKIILSAMLMAFVVAVQAADTKATTDKEAGCCAKAKVATEAQTECPMAKQAKGSCPFAAKAAAQKQAVAKQLVQSPKAAGQAQK